MKKIYLFFVALSLWSSVGFGQCTNIALNTQSAIDDFPTTYGCTAVTGTLIITGTGITNLIGLSQITSVGGLQISNVPLLTNYSGLNNLVSVGGNFSISGNTAPYISGFTGLTTVGGNFAITSCYNLISITGFSNLTTIGLYCDFRFNGQLSVCPVFSSLTSVGYWLRINGNSVMTVLPNFPSLTTCANFGIYQNDSLVNFTGLNSLTTVPGFLEILDNSALTSLTGLESLTNVGGNGYVEIWENDVLSNISAIGNANFSLTNLLIHDNPLLSVCNVPSVCNSIANGGSVSLYYNAEGCSSTAQVSVACDNDVVVHLKLFIEGYYQGEGSMRSVKLNQDLTSPTADVETITVELHSTSSPYATLYTTTSMLQTDGSAICGFGAAPDGLYYLSVSGLNCVKTWTANPVTVGTTFLSYDFTTGSNKAYGNNMKDLGGYFGFYSGDVNQDGSIDISDAPDLFDAVDASAFGIQITDLNGDGAVDNTDIPFYADNSDVSIYSHDPNNP